MGFDECERWKAGRRLPDTSMAHELTGSETVLTGWLEDRSALFGVLAQIERLGLELLEVRQQRGTNADG